MPQENTVKRYKIIGFAKRAACKKEILYQNSKLEQTEESSIVIIQTCLWPLEGSLSYKPVWDVPFFRLLFFSINS